MNTKEELINHLIKENGYRSYLEIGTKAGLCYNQIDIEHKVAVDPEPEVILDNQIIATSDTYFQSYVGEMFDIVLIDGLHHAEQALYDLDDALQFLYPGGTVLVHDMLPVSELVQRVPRVTQTWYGDVWKLGYAVFDQGELDAKIHDFDCGIMEVKEGMIQDLLPYETTIEMLDYDTNFEQYLEMIK